MELQPMNRFIHELKRRNVFKAAISYLVVAWIIIQVSDILIPIFKLSTGLEKWLVILLTILFPVWLVFAYVYELTPGGLKKTSEVDPAQSIRKETNKSLNKYIIMGLSLVVLLLIFDRFYSIDIALDESELDKSVAVLPFQNVSESEDAYFAEGITDDILTQVAQIKDLRVLSSLSLQGYEFQGKSPEQIGEELGVSYILLGNVRRSEDDLRIGCQLIGTNEEGAVWAKTFDRKMSNVFETQSEIAQQVARSLDIEMNNSKALAINKEQPTENMVAYDLFLKGRSYIKSNDRETMLKAIDLLKEAIALDPFFADAYAELSQAYTLIQNRASELPRSYIDTAKVLAQKSLDLNPELAEGWHALGLVYNEQGKREQSAAMYQKELEYNPNDPGALNNLGNYYTYTGEMAKAIELYKKAIQFTAVNSLENISEYVNLSNCYWTLGMFDASIEAGERALALKEDFRSYLHLGIAYYLKGDSLRSSQLLERMVATDPDNAAALNWGAIMFYEYGNQSMGLGYMGMLKDKPYFSYDLFSNIRLYEANEAIKENDNERAEPLLNDALNFYLEEMQRGNQGVILGIVQTYSLKNDPEKVNEWMKKLIDSGELNQYLFNSVLFDNVRENQEFQRLIQVMRSKVDTLREEVLRQEMNTSIQLGD